MITILNSAREQDENGWKESFLTLCRDICGQNQDKQPPEEEAHSRGGCCPLCGNLVMARRSEGRVEWTDCETCRRRAVTREDQLQTLVRSTQENVRYLLGVEIENELSAKRELWPRHPSTGWQTADEAFRIDTELSGRKERKKHEAVLTDRLPDAVIAAKVVRYLCSIFLGQSTEKLEHPEGLAEWFTVHYLFLIDRKDYARRIDSRPRKANEVEKGYRFWVQKLDSPLSTRIIRMSYVMKLAQKGKRQENFEVPQENTLQETSGQAGEAPGQGGQGER